MAQSPSNPSPFSPELQTFLITKYDPLLSVVKTLNDRVHGVVAENAKLSKRVAELDAELQELRAILLNTNNGSASLKEAVNEASKLPAVEGAREGNESEGLQVCSCPLGTPTSLLELMLDYYPDQTTELDVEDWSQEIDMWVDLLENLPTYITYKTPRSLTLAEVRSAATYALSQVAKSEVLIILHNVPGKNSLPEKNAALLFVTILLGSISESINMNASGKHGVNGRVHVVLEGKDIGRKITSGDLSINIKPLQ